MAYYLQIKPAVNTPIIDRTEHNFITTRAVTQ